MLAAGQENLAEKQNEKRSIRFFKISGLKKI
jgi:hypothetical protein